MIFEVDRQDIRTTRVVDAAPTTLGRGQVRLNVELFAFTSNNISYAIAGDMLDYWGFFPADAPWGRIPAIGDGGLHFGSYPMADELVVQAERRGDHGFRDVGPHRTDHAATYTDFRDIEAEAAFDVDRIDEYLLLWGMLMTSFLIDDQLGSRGFEGASTAIVTSASSKTSISLASCLAARADVQAIGLTSDRNRAFVEGLGLYDSVATYDEVTEPDSSVRAGLVDMAGNAQVRADIHRQYNASLAFSISVGATHWDQRDADPSPLPGPAPEFFFAPGQRAKRVEDWGAAELDARNDRAYRSLVDHSGGWLRVEHRQGPAGIEATYGELLDGSADPAAGIICIPKPEETTP
ncbi:MAG: DUF2855 family protein [Actinomycetia bacterium]|nr:DUF2855 family protein [Actinomycetes bacterium]